MGVDINKHLVVDRGTKPAVFLGSLGKACPGPRADCPPAIVVDGTVPEHLEVLGVVVARLCRLVEGLGKAHPVDWRLAHTPDALRGFHTQGFQDRRDEINAVGILLPDLTSRLDALWPGYDARIGGAAPIGFALPALEGGVAGIGPAPRVMVAGFHAAKFIQHFEIILEFLLHIVEEEHFVQRTNRPAFGAGAVIGDHDDQGIIQLAYLFQEFKNPPKMIIGEAEKPA